MQSRLATSPSPFKRGARARGTTYFAITRMGSAAFLGRVGLDRISASGTANVGYWVRTGQTGQGVATAAVLLITRFGFEDLGLQRLELLVAADNLASQRVAESVGATFEGVLPAGPHGQGELRAYLVLFLVGSLRSFGKASWPVTQRDPGASDVDIGRQRPM